jgi:GT2 family glycosyltransferase
MATETLDISVIVPFHNKAKMTLEAIRSLDKYGPKVKEILLISNSSTDDELQLIRAYMTKHDNVSLHEYNKPFNYQIVNNWAASLSTGKFILFLNNDTELRPNSRGLLEEMVKKASEPKVGMVGCLLLYGDEAYIQHAGVFLVSGGLADHMYVGEKYSTVLAQGGKTEKYPYSLTEDRPVTAVTGAVQLVERKKFDKVGGWNEDFYLCGGDVDLCLRLNRGGLQTWFVASKGKKYILHKESQSRPQMKIRDEDFYLSYLSYSQGYDPKIGDPFLPKICKLKEIKV